MSEPLEDADRRIMDVLAEVWNGGVITGYAVIAVGLDEEGQQRRYYNFPDDQPGYVTLGLLESFAAVERHNFVEFWMED